jgi:hypothetical protein
MAQYLLIEYQKVTLEVDMIRICVECKICYGIKEPLWDKSITHGLCDTCYSFITRTREEKLQLQLEEVDKKT